MTALKLYFVVGEASGDALGADLLEALERDGGGPIDAMGLAGPKLEKKGVASLFNIEDVSVMGIGAVLASLPKIVRHIYRTVDDIVEKNPDVMVLIDSPDFVQPIAKRVRKRAPHIPIINYVCPSVWAWRSGRAAKMAAYIDHVLALLPFEPRVLKELGGPQATYIGHPLANQLADQLERTTVEPQPMASSTELPTLLVLPGSRRSEVTRMMKPFGDTLDVLRARGHAFQTVIPAVSQVRDRIEEEAATWSVAPQIVSAELNNKTFPKAHLALAASGTVTLQLALHRVPMVAAYRLDSVGEMIARNAIKVWSASLPNLIADRMVVPEDYGHMVMPNLLARRLEALLTDSLDRQAQLAGFDEIWSRMATQEPASQMAARIVRQFGFGKVKPNSP
ncbi:MAG: lipid-A-disaccharide synthase [Pseudomonadota bacterium]